MNDNWKYRNARRLYLVERELAGILTRTEVGELAHLRVELLEELMEVHPLPALPE